MHLLAIEAAFACPPDLAMTRYENDIPHSVRQIIRERIGHLRAEIQIVKDCYGLDPQIISNRRRILAKLSLVSIYLTEATSRYLRGYGEVPENERRPLDEQMGKMISIVDDLNKLIS